MNTLTHTEFGNMVHDRIQLAYERGILKHGEHKKAIEYVAQEVESILAENVVSSEPTSVYVADLDSLTPREHIDQEGVVYRWKTGVRRLFNRISK